MSIKKQYAPGFKAKLDIELISDKNYNGPHILDTKKEEKR